MAKLYFYYGPMGCSKTANALMTRFNYLEKGRNIWLIKPSVDIRDGEDIIKSRIGISATAYIVKPEDNILDLLNKVNDRFCVYGEVTDPDVVIADEAQFFTTEQIDQLRDIATYRNIPVMCYGLRTDFQTKLFPGSQRLMELADEISELKSICQCGTKAIVNARFENGKIITAGDQVDIGGDEKYEALCWSCYQEKLKEAKN